MSGISNGIGSRDDLANLTMEIKDVIEQLLVSNNTALVEKVVKGVISESHGSNISPYTPKPLDLISVPVTELSGVLASHIYPKLKKYADSWLQEIDIMSEIVINLNTIIAGDWRQSPLPISSVNHSLRELSKLAMALNDPNAFWIVIPIQRVMLEILFTITTDPPRNELKEVLQLLSDQPQVLVYGKMIHEVASMMLDMLAENLKNSLTAGAQLTVGVVKSCLMLKVDEDLIKGAKKCFMAGVEIFKHRKADERLKMIREVSPYPGVSYADVLEASIFMCKYEGNWVISAAYIDYLTRISCVALHALQQRPDDSEQLRILHACVIGDGSVLGLEKILGRTQRKRRGKIGIELGLPGIEKVENFFLSGESASSFLQTIIAECLGELQEAGERLAADLLDKFKEKMETLAEKVMEKMYDKASKILDASNIAKEAKDYLEKSLRAAKTVIKEFDDCLKVIIGSMEKMRDHLQGMDKWLGVILSYAMPFMGEVDEVCTKETGCKTLVTRNDTLESMEDSRQHSRQSKISVYKQELEKLIDDEIESVTNKGSRATENGHRSETNSKINPHVIADGTPQENKTGYDKIKFLIDKVFVVRELIQESPSSLQEIIDVLQGVKGGVPEGKEGVKGVRTRLQELSNACDDLSAYLQPPKQSTVGQIMEPFKQIAKKTFLWGSDTGKVDNDNDFRVVREAIKNVTGKDFENFETIFSSKKMFAAKRVQVILQYTARAVGDLEECFGICAEEKEVMMKIARDLKDRTQAFFSEDVVKPLLNELGKISGEGWWKQAASLWDTALATVGLEKRDVGGALCMFREALQTLVGPGSSPPLVEEAAITAELEIELMMYYLVNSDQAKGMDQLTSIHQCISERISKTKAMSTTSIVQQLLLQTKYSEKVKYLFGTNWSLIEHDVMSGHKRNAKEMDFAKKAIRGKVEHGETRNSFESSCLHTVDKTPVESSIKATLTALNDHKGSSTKAGMSGVSSALIIQLTRLEKKASQSRRRIILMFARKYLDEEKPMNRYRYIYVIRDGHSHLNPRHLVDRTGMTTTPLDGVYDDNEEWHVRHQGEGQAYPFVPTRRPRPFMSITDGTIISTPLPRRAGESPSISRQGSARFLYFGKGNNNRSDRVRPSSAGSRRTMNTDSPALMRTASNRLRPSSPGSWISNDSESPAPVAAKPSNRERPSSAGSRTQHKPVTSSSGLLPRYSFSRGVTSFTSGDARVAVTGTRGTP